MYLLCLHLFAERSASGALVLSFAKRSDRLKRSKDANVILMTTNIMEDVFVYGFLKMFGRCGD